VVRNRFRLAFDDFGKFLLEGFADFFSELKIGRPELRKFGLLVGGVFLVLATAVMSALPPVVFIGPTAPPEDAPAARRRPLNMCTLIPGGFH
jgi:hypothetical protein